MAALTLTETEVLRSSGNVDRTHLSAAALTTGQVVYLTTSSTWALADANQTQVLSGYGATVGIVLTNAQAAAQPCVVQTDGVIILGASATVVTGTIYYLSNTIGGIAAVADLTTGGATSYVTVLGIASGSPAASLNLFINPTGVFLV